MPTQIHPLPRATHEKTQNSPIPMSESRGATGTVWMTPSVVISMRNLLPLLWIRLDWVGIWSLCVYMERYVGLEVCMYVYMFEQCNTIQYSIVFWWIWEEFYNLPIKKTGTRSKSIHTYIYIDTKQPPPRATTINSQQIHSQTNKQVKDN